MRRWLFLAGLAGFLAFYLWGLTGLPAFGRYGGPYGFVINRIAVSQTNATGVVSAVNFDYRGVDTVGEEFILFAAATGVATVLRQMRAEQRESPADGRPATPGDSSSEPVRLACLLFTGPTALIGWFLATHAQTSPSGGFQGGVVLATAFLLIYLGGELAAFRRVSPGQLMDSAGAIGAAGFAVTGLVALFLGLPYLDNFLPHGIRPGAVSSSGTIALISFLVGIEVAAAFVLIAAEFVQQTVMISERSES